MKEPYNPHREIYADDEMRVSIVKTPRDEINNSRGENKRKPSYASYVEDDLNYNKKGA